MISRLDTEPRALTESRSHRSRSQLVHRAVASHCQDQRRCVPCAVKERPSAWPGCRAVPGEENQPLPDDDAAFQKKTAHLIDHGGPLADEERADPVRACRSSESRRVKWFLPILFRGQSLVNEARARHSGAPSPEQPAAYSQSRWRRERGRSIPFKSFSAGLLALVHNTYAAASIAAAEMTKTTAMSTTAHM